LSAVHVAREPKRVHTIVNAARKECVRHDLPRVSPFYVETSHIRQYPK
jgi:hypothetical protein